MNKLNVLLIVMLFVSCTKNSTQNDEYWRCEQLLDTTGLKLYPFEPFSDDFGPGKTPFVDLLEARQIPEDFLRGMTTKELFYQFVYTERTMTIYNTPDKRFNMVTELLNRPDAGQVLLGLLQKYVPTKISGDCYYWGYFLKIFSAQTEVINLMTDEEIYNYIHHQLRINEIIKNMYKDDYSSFCFEMRYILIGLGNVMIRYEFEPFIQYLWNQNTSNLMWPPTTSDNSSVQCDFQIINYVEQFINFKK